MIFTAADDMGLKIPDRVKKTAPADMKRHAIKYFDLISTLLSHCGKCGQRLLKEKIVVF